MVQIGPHLGNCGSLQETLNIIKEVVGAVCMETGMLLLMKVSDRFFQILSLKIKRLMIGGR